MADLPESNEWTEGIYQFETSDPVLGGPEGIDNLQGKQLANRTKWLKDQIAKIVEGATSIGKAVQLQTARALEFKGAATGTGNFDGSADTEITLTLANSGVTAGSYPKVTVNAKGIVTGGAALAAGDLPEGVTAPQFDNDTTLATTAFAKRMGVEWANFNTVSVSSVLGLGSVGGVVSVASATAVNITLPPTASVLHGGAILLLCAGDGAATLLASAGDLLTNAAGITVPIVLGKGDSALLTKVTGEWRLVLGSTALKHSAAFAGVLGSSGRQRLPNGMLMQWVSVATPTTQGASTSFSWPIAFDNALNAVSFAPDFTVAGYGYLTLAVVNRNKTGAQLLNNGLSATLGSVVATTIIGIGY
ncbi:gp53-like domain-containing protein [Pseudomonas lini]